MKATIKQKEDVLVFLMKGDLTSEFVNDFESKLKNELKRGAKKILIVMDAVSRIDDIGYQILGSCMAASNRNGTNFVLYFENPDRLEQFNQSSYAEFFNIVTDMGDAKRELSKPRRKQK
ncbi:MAG: hypothetical protein B6244_00550 [Candidatus Cloacimonetes bacterium 4572_55]|nr:MAG: hypothetical protein B6244_00550 [Candidatus Cloacimonetes bacterium 4572_55]